MRETHLNLRMSTLTVEAKATRIWFDADISVAGLLIGIGD